VASPVHHPAALLAALKKERCLKKAAFTVTAASWVTGSAGTLGMVFFKSK
jgi:hypothetical protein